MSLYNDQKYINLLSPQLEGFTKKKDYLYNFRCPVCGDSKKKSKKRGYVFRKTSGLFFMCHNCGHSTTLGNLIKIVSPSLHKEYVMDAYKDSNYGGTKVSKKEITKTFDIPKPKFKKKSEYEKNTIASLDDEHPAKKYIVNRNIPTKFLNDMFYVEDFKEYVDSILPNNKYKLFKNDPRIVIPFRSKSGILIAVQGRAVGDSDLRYVTIKIREDLPKIYGMDRVDISKRLYVVEGPFDSMFLDNTVAMAGADMSGELRKNTVFIFDNEKRNHEITKRMSKVLDRGYHLCIWPENLKEKDINDMILSGKSSRDIEKIIDDNLYTGLSGKFKLKTWIR